MLRLLSNLATQSMIGIFNLAWALAVLLLTIKESPRSAATLLALADVFIVPVVSTVIGVQLPMAPGCVIAAVAVGRAVEIVQSGRSRVRHAIDVRIDGLTVLTHVGGNRYRRFLLARIGGPQ